jgi:ribonuclease HI
MAKLVNHVHDPLVVEAMALWRALALCRDVRASQVEFEGDSLAVIQAVKTGNSGWSSMVS